MGDPATAPSACTRRCSTTDPKSMDALRGLAALAIQASDFDTALEFHVAPDRTGRTLLRGALQHWPDATKRPDNSTRPSRCTGTPWHSSPTCRGASQPGPHSGIQRQIRGSPHLLEQSAPKSSPPWRKATSARRWIRGPGAQMPHLIQRAVEQAFRLPCRYSYRHSPEERRHGRRRGNLKGRSTSPSEGTFLAPHYTSGTRVRQTLLQLPAAGRASIGSWFSASGEGTSRRGWRRRAALERTCSRMCSRLTLGRVPGCILASTRAPGIEECPVEKGGLQCPVICSKYPTARQRGPL